MGTVPAITISLRPTRDPLMLQVIEHLDTGHTELAVLRPAIADFDSDRKSGVYVGDLTD